MMHRRFVHDFLFRFPILCLFCLFSFHPTISVPESEEVADLSVLLEQPTFFKTGDIIFRKGVGAGSHIVEMVDEQSLFSHVGLVKVIDGKVFVIHAIPESLNGEGWVRLDPLADFLAQSTAVALYRLQEPYHHFAETAVAETLPWIDEVPFDTLFDLSSAESLYCTELVWLAYQSAGIDLVDNQFDELDLPFHFGGTYLLPSRLSLSPYLQSIIQIPPQMEATK